MEGTYCDVFEKPRQMATMAAIALRRYGQEFGVDTSLKTFRMSPI